MPLRVLVTGHNGYIGSVLTPKLTEQGHTVVGLDTCYFSECTLVEDQATVPVILKDIRDLEADDLDGFDAVVHLAALSNDPIGSLNKNWTDEINFRASVRLAELARTAGVRRLLFSSSCIMYGTSVAALADEDSPLAPQTIYAESKVRGEQAISKLADDDFSPVFLRNGTIYGLSPRMRFDTVLNSLAASAFTTRKVVVFSDGTPWRPVVHIEDVCSAFIAFLEAPKDVIHNQAFNVGADAINYQIRDLAEAAAEAVPECTIEYLSEADADQRTYKTNFAKIGRALPEFQIQWTARRGAQQLYETFSAMGLTREQSEGERFIRLRWLNKLISENRLDDNLRWISAAPEEQL